MLSYRYQLEIDKAVLQNPPLHEVYSEIKTWIIGNNNKFTGYFMHFLLIHGSWHGAWCWEKLTPYFLADNHQVTCIDLPGSGERFGEIDKVTFDVLVDAAKRF